MADSSLTIGLGADSSKLRADLAVAQAEVRQFGNELRAAAKESLATGDKTQVAELAGKYDAATKNVTQLKGALAATNSEVQQHSGHLQTLRGHLDTVHQGFGKLHEGVTRAGAAMSNLATSVFPGFKEILALGTIATGAGLYSVVRGAAEWAHGIEATALQLGTSEKMVMAWGKAAKLAGVDSGVLNTALARFSINLEKAADAQRKLAIEGATLKATAGDGVALRGGRNDARGAPAGKLAEPGGGSVAEISQFIDQGAALHASLQKANEEQVKLGRAPLPGAGDSLDTYLGGILSLLQKGGKEADEMRERLVKMGAAIPARTTSEALKRLEPGYIDDFTKLGVSTIDPLSLRTKPNAEALGQFAEGFKKLDDSAGLKVLREKFGRGAIDPQFVALLKEGREGLFKYADAWKKMGVDVETGSDESVQAGAKLFKTIIQFESAVSRVKKTIGLAFGDVFGPVFEHMADGIEAALPEIKKFATTVAQDLRGMFSGTSLQGFLSELRQFIVSMMSLGSAVKGVADWFGRLFGASGYTVLAVAAFAAMSGILVPLAALIAVGGAFGAGIVALGVGLVVIWRNAGGITAAFDGLWTLLKAVAGYIAGEFSAAWTATWEAFIAPVTRAVNAVVGAIQTVIDKAKAAASAVASALGLGGGSAAPVAEAAIPGKAAGGYISGPGSGTSDSILARVSNGEFVMRAAAVSRIGAGNLQRMNDLGGYAAGGLIGRGPSLPSFAEGGMVSSRAPVHLHLGGKSYALHGSESVVDSLVGAAHGQQMRSAGVKPSWYGGRPGG